MQNHEQVQPTGNLKISREVIATIARYAALEIEGVASLAAFSPNLKGLIKRQVTRPIAIELNDEIATITIHLNVKAGVNIPQVSERVQAAVKETVQTMTGIAVNRVNIVVSGIVFDGPAGATQQPE